VAEVSRGEVELVDRAEPSAATEGAGSCGV